MKEFVEFMIKQFVSLPDAVTVTETMEADMHVLSVHVANEDMGLVIGREGKTINSIRNLAKAKAIKDNIMIKILLDEPNAKQDAAN